jgi:hypothetical protein
MQTSNWIEQELERTTERLMSDGADDRTGLYKHLQLLIACIHKQGQKEQEKAE